MKTAPGRRQQEQPERRINHAGRLRYYTVRWARLRKLVLARDKHICQRCGMLGNEIDHVTPWMSDDSRFWNQANLQTLCRKCHSKKTNEEMKHGQQ